MNRDGRLEVSLTQAVALERDHGRGVRIRGQIVGVVPNHSGKISYRIRRKDVLMGTHAHGFEVVAVLPLTAPVVLGLVKLPEPSGRAISVSVRHELSRFLPQPYCACAEAPPVSKLPPERSTCPCRPVRVSRTVLSSTMRPFFFRTPQECRRRKRSSVANVLR